MDSDDPPFNDTQRSQPGNPVLENQLSHLPDATTLPPARGNSGRCLLYGCSVVFISGIFLILCAGFGTYYYFTRQVENFTSETPQVLPSQEYDELKMAELETRVQEFERTLAADEKKPEVVLEEVEEAAPEEGAVPKEEVTSKPKPKSKPRQLSLSAADLNALIARQPRLKNKLFVKINDGVITGDLSLPLDSYVPGGKGRFFNGSGTFDVSLQDGVLAVRLVSAMVGEQPIPPAVMSEIRKQNLASEFQQDAKAQRSIRRFERIEVDGDRMILTLKEP